MTREAVWCMMPACIVMLAPAAMGSPRAVLPSFAWCARAGRFECRTDCTARQQMGRTALLYGSWRYTCTRSDCQRRVTSSGAAAFRTDTLCTGQHAHGPGASRQGCSQRVVSTSGAMYL